MDHLITYKEAVGFIKNPPSLALRPDFAKNFALRKHYVTGLKQLTCPQNLIHGWAGLVMDLVMYTLLEPTTPFAAVVDPGKYAIYANFATKVTMKMTDKIFEQNKNYYLSVININRECFCMLNDNIANQFKVSNMPNMTGWNSTMTVRLILKGLENSYRKPNTMSLFQNDTLFRSPFPATEAPEMLVYRIEQCQEIQTIAQDPYTPKQIISNAVCLLMQSGIFPLKE
jgi:hypothetical protein